MKPSWKEIFALDRERMDIENRIAIRAALHNGKIAYKNRVTGKVLPIEGAEMRLLDAHPAAVDAARYVAIEDRCWQLLGLHDTGSHEQPPL